MEAEVQEPKVIFQGDVNEDTNTPTGFAPEEEVKEDEKTADESKPEEQQEADTQADEQSEVEEKQDALPDVSTEKQTDIQNQAEQQEADPYDMLGLKDKERDLIEGAIKALKAGDLENFLRVRSTDWDKVPDIDIVRQTIEQKYKDLDPEDRDYMVNRDLAKYNTDSFDEDEARAVKIGLKMDAKTIRDGLKAEQEQYKIPERPDTSSEETVKMEKAQKAAAEFNERLFADPALAEFETNKAVKLGSGENAFNYVADKVNIKEIITNGSLNDYLIDQPKGVPKFNMPKFIRDAAVLKNLDDIADKLIAHGKMLGKREADAELRNPGQRTAAAPDKTDGIRFIGDI